MLPAAHTSTAIHEHWWTTATVAAAGPSPWYHCSRPSCRLVYRTLAFARVTPPACPMCGQVVIPAKHGLPLTAAQREAVAA